MQRDSAKGSVTEAREGLNAASNAFQAKQRELEPLQTGRKNQNELQSRVQAEFKDLEVRSEQELDAKVNRMTSHSYRLLMVAKPRCLHCGAHTTSPECLR